MRNCTQCHTEVPEGAPFCDHCGAEQVVKRITCTYCEGWNDPEADYCIHCGSYMDSAHVGNHVSTFDYASYKAKYPLDFTETVRLPLQLRTYFLKALEAHLKVKGHSDLFDEYVDFFYNTPFLKKFDREALDMAEQSYLLRSDNQQQTDQEVDQYLEGKFRTLIDEMVRDGGILSNNNNTNIDAGQDVGQVASNVVYDTYNSLILETLKMGEEQEKWYADIEDMPKLKLKNALESFLFPEPDEKIFLICDQTIFGSCREGFALTSSGLYWKAHFNTAKQINYKDIETLELSEEWLVINDLYFNATPAVNVKMMQLLERLKIM